MAITPNHGAGQRRPGRRGANPRGQPREPVLQELLTQEPERSEFYRVNQSIELHPVESSRKKLNFIPAISRELLILWARFCTCRFRARCWAKGSERLVVGDRGRGLPRGCTRSRYGAGRSSVAGSKPAPRTLPLPGDLGFVGGGVDFFGAARGGFFTWEQMFRRPRSPSMSARRSRWAGWPWARTIPGGAAGVAEAFGRRLECVEAG